MPSRSPASQETVHASGAFTYSATAGTTRVKTDSFDCEIFSTFYRMLDRDVERPITFLFNGGPGSSSAYLHLMGLGPRRMAMNGVWPKPTTRDGLVDCPESWLAFSDLVFVDPVGTGYSRAADEHRIKEVYWTSDNDVAYLSAYISQWLNENGRESSPVYLLGESYSGQRVPRIARHLQLNQGFLVAGVVLVSPSWDLRFLTWDDPLSFLAFVTRLPTMALTLAELEDREVNEAWLREVEEYSRGEYLADLLAGPSGLDRIHAHVHTRGRIVRNSVLRGRARGRQARSMDLRAQHQKIG